MAELVNKNNYLQEKNWKLQIELEVVKGMIPPETMSTVYPVKYKEFMVCCCASLCSNVNKQFSSVIFRSQQLLLRRVV